MTFKLLTISNSILFVLCMPVLTTELIAAYPLAWLILMIASRKMDALFDLAIADTFNERMTIVLEKYPQEYEISRTLAEISTAIIVISPVFFFAQVLTHSLPEIPHVATGLTGFVLGVMWIAGQFLLTRR